MCILISFLPSFEMNEINQISVKTPRGHYNIQIGNGCLGHMLENAIEECRSRRSISRIIAIVDEVFRERDFALPPARLYVCGGEIDKSRESKAAIEDQLIELNCDRNSVLIAIGGGSIGDLVGFVASTFMRGIRFIQVPTSLLAMVDSSVGGKTAVNTDRTKNVIGAFHQPQAVVIDTAFLDTLPQRHIANGMAEIIKAGFAGDINLWYKLQVAHPKISELIIDAIQYKVRIVEMDERDSGIRNELNFGHTIGHAIEKKFRTLLHGECVAIGMVYELMCLRAIKFLEDDGDILKLIACLEKFNLPTFMPAISDSMSEFEKLLLGDKKACHLNSDKQMEMVPLVAFKKLGSCVLASRTISVPLETVVRIISPFALISSPVKSVTGSIKLPGSKSVANRALLLAAMTGRNITLDNIPNSVDVHIMKTALMKFGFNVLKSPTGLTVGPPIETFLPETMSVFVGNSGTTARFLLPFAAFLISKHPNISVTFTCDPRMEERPIKSLINSLVEIFPQLRVETIKGADSFPLELRYSPDPNLTGFPHCVSVDASESSQFVSGILMMAPLLGRELRINLVAGKSTSRGFIDMTIRMMKIFGCTDIISGDNGEYVLSGSGYSGPIGSMYSIPGDAAAASYPLAMAAITGGRVEVNVVDDGLQSDYEFVHLLSKLGCKVEMGKDTTQVTGPEKMTPLSQPIDMSEMTDTFLTAAVLLAQTSSHARICNIANQRVKECDRITAIALNLNKCGYSVREETDGLSFYPSENGLTERSVVAVPTFNDHRVAMSMSVLSLIRPVAIENPRCVEKTFPNFFDTLVNGLGIKVTGLNSDRSCGLQYTVCLIGMRGIGKTTIGKKLSFEIANCRFIDLDEEVEYLTGRSVDHIIAQDGWDSFRLIENNCLKRVVYDAERMKQLTLLATGGGVVESQSSRMFLKLINKVFWIRSDDDSTIQYAQEAIRGSQFPQTVSQTYLRRKGLYKECSRADVYIDRKNQETTLYNIKRLINEPKFELRNGGTFVCLTAESYRSWTKSDFSEAIAGPSVDAVEIRVDKLNQIEEIFDLFSPIRKFIDKPIILTLRTSIEGGQFNQIDLYSDMIKRLARLCPEYIDVEVGQVESTLTTFLNENKELCRVIASVHSSEPPTVTGIRRAAEAVLAPSWSSIGKVVFHKNESHGTQNFDYQKSEKPLIFVCTGAGGIVSRIVNPLLTPVCSSLRKKLTAAAPGQIDAYQLDLIRTGGISCIPTMFFFHLLGSPIEKSPSPFIHNNMFSMRNLGGVCMYTARASSCMEDVKSAIHSPSFRGASVTIPLKEKVFEYLSDLTAVSMSEDAVLAKSVNTVSLTSSGHLRGDNTDIAALRKALKGITGKNCLVLGTGGAARGGIVAAKASCEQVYVYGRNKEKVTTLCEEFGVNILEKETVTEVDVIISCTPSSGQYEFIRDYKSLMNDKTWLVEMAYVPRITPLVELALYTKASVVYGSRVLFLQAVEQHNIWIESLRMRNELPGDVLLESEISETLEGLLDIYSKKFHSYATDS
jgi:pentafunctional AROM polypeptide